MTTARGWHSVTFVVLLAAWLLALALCWWFAAGTATWFALALAGVILVALAGVLRAVVRPVEELAQRASRLAAGELDVLATPCDGIVEVEALRRALNAMSEHVRRAQTTGQAYATALSEGQEAERARLAHELHDATVQSLIAISQRLDRAGRLIDTDPGRARTLVADARQDTTAAVAGLREIIADIRPPALDELGLVPALELLVSRLPSQPATRLEVDGPVRRLPPERELAALRMVQEALSNVRRHAAATEAIVRLHFVPDALHLDVIDDGRGFVVGRSEPEHDAHGHWGLIGMEERAARFGGAVSVDSAPGRGTRLTIIIPSGDVAQPDSMVVDPVCKATILPATAYGSSEYADQTYYFCCPVCQGAFQSDPTHYVA